MPPVGITGKFKTGRAGKNGKHKNINEMD